MENYATASTQELKEYARDELGLALTLTMSAETMRQKIKDKLAETGKSEPVPEKTERKLKGAKYRTIMIPDSEKPGGSEPVFVGYNGRGFTIPRGVECSVPEPLIEILKNARQDIITQGTDGEMITKTVMAYPFQIVA